MEIREEHKSYLVIQDVESGQYLYEWEDLGFPHTSGVAWTENPYHADKFELMDPFTDEPTIEKPMSDFLCDRYVEQLRGHTLRWVLIKERVTRLIVKSQAPGTWSAPARVEVKGELGLFGVMADKFDEFVGRMGQKCTP